VIIISTFIVVIGGIIVLVYFTEPDVNPPLENKIHVNNIRKHLVALNDLAINGSRSVLTGYQASANYVIQQLQLNTQFQVFPQNFTVPVFIQNASPQLSVLSPISIPYIYGTDFAGIQYGGNGAYNLENPLFVVQNLGCNTSDFTGFVPLAIALIQYNSTSDCPLINKAQNAMAANASAVIIVNDILAPSLLTGVYDMVRASAWFAGDPLATIPVLTASYSVGVTLRGLAAPVISLVSDTTIVLTQTQNILCSTADGADNQTIVIGAHLDSSPQGPGINGNGAGSATLLELAIQWSKAKLKATNRIIFAWWGASEIGLLGSRYYLNNLQANISQIALNLNLDMLASPNWIPLTYDGNSPSPTARPGSAQITQIFLEHWEQPYNFTLMSMMTGNSDFFSFAELGIPTGGVSAGSTEIKTDAERVKYGGFAATMLDPCFLQSCDNINNINTQILEELAIASAITLQTVAQHKDLQSFLNGTSVF